MNRSNVHWILGDIDLVSRHMTLYDCRKRGDTIELDYFGRMLSMFPYLLRAAGFYRARPDIPFSLQPFTISLAADCPQMAVE